MPIVQTGISIVLEKFPDHTDKVKRLFRQDRTFQEQCEDYRECCKALEYWNRSDKPNGLSRKQEYEEILKELEREILQSLNELE